MSIIKVQEYLKEDGSSPYQEWFDGIGEYKIDWGSGYWIYLAQDGKQPIVLFGGGTKKNQQSDINRAKELYQEYKRRKKEISKEQATDNDNRDKR